MVRFNLGPLLQGQMKVAKLKSADNLLIICPRGLQCETNLQEMIGWESSDVVRFCLGPHIQGQTMVLLALVSCLSGGYNLHRFSDALGLVEISLLFNNNNIYDIPPCISINVLFRNRYTYV